MKLLYVVVLYEQNFFNTNVYRTLIRKEEQHFLFVYDNSSQAKHLKSEFKGKWEYIHDPANGGLSKAYNKAALFAKRNGFEWILLLDQDTIFSPCILKSYERIQSKYPEIKLIVPSVKIEKGTYISPTKIHWWGNRSSKMIPNGILSLFKYSPINSGMLIQVSAFWEVGGYNEKVKLDYSDYQFIERLRKKYPSFYVMKETILQNFSSLVDSIPIKKKRYALFCQSIKHFETNSILQKISCFTISLKRAFSLIIQLKEFSPLKIWYTNYLKK